MKVELLLEYPDFIPEISKLVFQEFSYLVPEKTLQAFKTAFEAHLNSNKLPVTYVVVENKCFIGSFSLRESDLSTHSHLSPWMGSILVHPDKRNKGIGTFLVSQAQIVIKQLGYDQLYLFNLDKAAWYTKLGWQIVEHTLFNNVPVTIMLKSLKTPY